MHMIRVSDLYELCEGYGEFWGMTTYNYNEVLYYSYYVCFFDPEYVALDSMKAYDIFPRSLLDVSGGVPSQSSVTFPLSK